MGVLREADKTKRLCLIAGVDEGGCFSVTLLIVLGLNLALVSRCCHSASGASRKRECGRKNRLAGHCPIQC